MQDEKHARVKNEGLIKLKRINLLPAIMFVLLYSTHGPIPRRLWSTQPSVAQTTKRSHFESDLLELSLYFAGAPNEYNALLVRI